MRGHKGALQGSYRRSDDCGVEVCWGATYLLKPMRRMTRPHRGAVTLLAVLVFLSGMLLTLAGRYLFANHQRAAMNVLSVSASIQARSQPYQGRNARFAYPEGIELASRTYAQGELRDEKLLRVDAEHPIPERFAALRTVRVAEHGSGVVPVRTLDTRASRETVEALHRFFCDARQAGVEGLTIWQGALSALEQHDRQLRRIEQYAATMDVAQAANKALRELDSPEHCEYRLGCCVDIRLCAPADGQPDERPLRMTVQGRYLITHAWQYGLIRRFPADASNPDRQYRFRYVGVAHSVAMAELGLTLEEYLDVLHEQRVVTIVKNGAPRYVIVCQPIVDGYVNLWLPKGAVYQAGMDNTGYAVVACTLP